jgi:nicotinamidase-related amidase
MDRLVPESSLVLVVDVQERLFVAMPEQTRARLVKNAEILLEAAKILGVKVLASEQYPKGLGPTIEPIRAKLEAAPLAKVEFDACGDPHVSRAIGAARARSVIVIGMETHVCVFQTARELARRGYVTHVVADAVASRTEENRVAGLALCERAGAVVTVTEALVFDWLRAAGTDAFKQVSKLVR